VQVRPYMFSGRNTRLRYPVQSLKFLQVIPPAVPWLHSHLSFFHYLIATVGNLLPRNSFTLTFAKPM